MTLCKAIATVMLFGDSTMIGVDGADVSRVVARPPAAILQAELERRLGRGRVRVIDHAGGYTARRAIDGTDNHRTPLRSIAPADVNVFNHGINDQAASTEAAYRQALQVFAGFGGRVLFVTPTAPRAAPFAAVMVDEARRARINVAPAHELARRVPAAYFPDGVHGSQRWYDLVTRQVLAPAVAAEAAQVLCPPH